MYIVTGGAGFIGSCVVRMLNDAGIEDIVIVDNIRDTDKWLNLRNKKYLKYVPCGDFLAELSDYHGVTHIIHMGACAATTERDFDYLWRNNVEYTKTLWRYCAEHGASFIYASSAATYGDGQLGFDDAMNIDALRPLNGYGYSKQVVDQWACKQARWQRPIQNVGLKFFNVYGPNEYFKGSMASMIFHGYKQIRADGEIRLFKSCNSEYEDGGQLRDFVYVKDVAKVIIWLTQHPEVSGLFNVGTGRAQSFRELAEATFQALGLEPNIHYIEMPETLRDRYQYFTQAKMERLREAGYDKPFCTLKEGALDYVCEHLTKGFAIY